MNGTLWRHYIDDPKILQMPFDKQYQQQRRCHEVSIGRRTDSDWGTDSGDSKPSNPKFWSLLRFCSLCFGNIGKPRHMVITCGQNWLNFNSPDRKGHKEAKYLLFFANNFWTKQAGDTILVPSCFPLESRQNICMFTVKVKVKISPLVMVTWIYVMSQAGYVAYQSMRLREGNTLGPSTVLYLYILSKVTGKNEFDLIWPRIT